MASRMEKKEQKKIKRICEWKDEAESREVYSNGI
jgi:hypothetical protein